MKKLLTIVVLTTLLASCNKDKPAAPPPSLSGNLLTSFWFYLPAAQALAVDSLEYDEAERLARFKSFQFTDVTTRTIPAFDAVKDDSLMLTFSYQGQDTLPVSYHLYALKEQAAYQEDHLLTYDDQRRLISDSVKGVTGNETDGYSPTYFNVRVTRYAYQPNLVIAHNYYCDLGVNWDSSWVNSSGNVPEFHVWNDKMYATPDGLGFTMLTTKFSDVDNPFYKFQLFRGSFYSSLLMGGETYTSMSKKMELGSSFVAPNATADLYTTLEWVTDDKHRVISGVYDGENGVGGFPSTRTEFSFRYR